MSCALQIQWRMMEMSEDTLDIYKAFPPKREYIKHNGKFDFFFMRSCGQVYMLPIKRD